MACMKYLGKLAARGKACLGGRVTAFEPRTAALLFAHESRRVRSKNASCSLVAAGCGSGGGGLVDWWILLVQRERWKRSIFGCFSGTTRSLKCCPVSLATVGGANAGSDGQLVSGITSSFDMCDAIIWREKRANWDGALRDPVSVSAAASHRR